MIDRSHVDTAGAVVIGGVLGCCVTYHLRQAGAGRVPMARSA